ncbi:MAG: FG-GAP repeat protein [Planctomycetota bacterium JB042]
MEALSRVPVAVLALVSVLSFDAAAQCTGPKVGSSNGGAVDKFGDVTAISGDLLVVGAQFHDGVGQDSGAAYVFERSGSAWVEAAFLTSSDIATNDRFGSAVDTDGTRVIVGVRYNNDPGYGGGNAYVFERVAGSWVELQKIAANDQKANDFFGDGVAIDGDTALIGAPFDDDGGPDAGTVYVLDRTLGLYQESALLTAPDAQIDDRFGQSVDLSGDRALVGAPLRDEQGANSGVAYVFERSGTFQPAAKLVPSIGGVDWQAGIYVAIDGDTAVVAAPLASIDVPRDGAVFVFEREPSGAWVERDVLRPPVPSPNLLFGTDVDVDGDVLIVGARGDDTAASNAGAAYVFRRGPSGWKGAGMLRASDATASDDFGHSVAVSGPYVAVGARHAPTGGVSTGAVYLFDHSDEIAYQGQGCPGTGGFVPGLRLAGCPAPGGSVRLSIERGLGGGASFLVVGTPGTGVPLGSGCVLHVGGPLRLVGPLALSGGGPGDGALQLDLVVPPGTPTGVTATQAFVVDVSAPSGFCASNGLRVEL